MTGPAESGGLDTGKGPGAAALRLAFSAAAGGAQAGVRVDRGAAIGRGLGAARPGQQGTEWTQLPHRRGRAEGWGQGGGYSRWSPSS